MGDGSLASQRTQGPVLRILGFEALGNAERFWPSGRRERPVGMSRTFRGADRIETRPDALGAQDRAESGSVAGRLRRTIFRWSIRRNALRERQSCFARTVDRLRERLLL